MKCPKCHYLGFDTGDRCRNCGYDFSLLAVPTPDSRSDVAPEADAASPDAEMPLHELPVDLDRLGDVPIDQLALAGPALPGQALPGQALSAGNGDAVTTRRAGALPLFLDTADDRPLITFPAAPRAPLSVRKTTDGPRVKPASLSRRRLTLDDDPQLELSDATALAETVRERPRAVHHAPAASSVVEPCTPGARIGAAMLDLAMLLAIDLLVLYFTLRMAALPFGEWQALPLVPFAAFLLLIKVAYYWAFTAIGGQTIGKMAMRIRVIADEGVALDPTTALRRTVLAVASVLTLGAAFLPALVRRDRRAVHDQIAHTRVVALPAA
jgi:uncharacterized RDD family membrane protein YckC